MATKKSSKKPAPSKEIKKREMKKMKGGNIGSQSTGAGAGKVTFNPFSITR